MKKMATLLFFIIIHLNLLAPSTQSLYIAEEQGIEPFKQLIYAIGKVECNFDTLAYNVKEEATGYFQIRPIRVNDFNKRTGRRYVLNDMFDYDIAESVFLWYAHQIGPHDMEKIAKSWNGSGPKVIEYWDKVKRLL